MNNAFELLGGIFKRFVSRFKTTILKHLHPFQAQNPHELADHSPITGLDIFSNMEDNSEYLEVAALQSSDFILIILIVLAVAYALPNYIRRWISGSRN